MADAEEAKPPDPRRAYEGCCKTCGLTVIARKSKDLKCQWGNCTGTIRFYKMTYSDSYMPGQEEEDRWQAAAEQGTNPFAL